MRIRGKAKMIDHDCLNRFGAPLAAVHSEHLPPKCVRTRVHAQLEALLLRLLVLLLSLVSLSVPASAQSPAPTAAGNLSLEQQTKLSDAITRDAGTPVPAGLFPLVVDKEVPANVPLRPVPATAAAAAPQFKGASYVVVEEQIAIVDTHTRKILAVIQRGRSQTTGSVPITDCIAAADIAARRPRGPLHCLLSPS